jgi:hypothetical protein
MGFVSGPLGFCCDQFLPYLYPSLNHDSCRPHFSETWGSPYDPHSYASAWEAEDNEINNALVALEAPSSREELLGLIEVS